MSVSGATRGLRRANDRGTEQREVEVPLAGGAVTLRVPGRLSDTRLIQEIASQDVIRKKLLDVLEKLERGTGSNRELLLCPRSQLEATSRGFLATSHDLRSFAEDLATFHSVIPELEEARGTAQTLFRGQVEQAIRDVEDMQRRLFETDGASVRHLSNDELTTFRKKLAKGAGASADGSAKDLRSSLRPRPTQPLSRQRSPQRTGDSLPSVHP